MNKKTRRTVAFLLLSTVGALSLYGCVVRPTQQPMQTVQTQSVYYTQTPQVVYTQPQPIVYQPQPVVIQRPAVYFRSQPIIYRQTSPVMTPVRISVPGQILSNYYSNNCIPGTTQACEAYCGGGVQYCNPDGMSWGACVENY